jgi:hypothetical protein
MVKVNMKEPEYTISQAACAIVEAIGLLATTIQQMEDERYFQGCTLYDFHMLIEKYGLHHNAMMARRD